MTALGFIIYATLIVIGCVGAVLFPVLYTIQSRPHWWKSEVGIHIFSFSSLFAIIYVRSLLGLFNPLARATVMAQTPGNVIFIFFATTLAAFVVWQRIWIFFEARREERHQLRLEDDIE